MNAYRRRILTLMRSLLEPHGPYSRMLDFGSGDGWFAQMLREAGVAKEIALVDVQRRKQTVVEPILYDGRVLPFADRCFDLVTSIDVLHHCPDPRASLKDLMRCCGNNFLIKDHTYNGWPGWLTLCMLDEIGNSRFGIPSLYHYQHGWEWSSWLAEEGFVLEHLIHPAPCHQGLLGRATNSLQYLALWRRKDA